MDAKGVGGEVRVHGVLCGDHCAGFSKEKGVVDEAVGADEREVG